MLKKRINLLPPDEQKRNRLLETNFQIIRFGFVVSASLVVLGLCLFVSSLFFANTLDQTQFEIETHNQVLARFQKQGLEKEILVLNETMSNFDTLLKNPTKWSPYLVELAQILPEGMKIESLTMDSVTRKVEVTGKAQVRSSVLQFRRNIIQSRNFENINFPLANIESAANVAWKYRFYLKTHAQ